MDDFAFMIHPGHVDDLARKFKFTRYVPDKFIERVFAMLPPMKVSHITGIQSTYGNTQGWFIGCPLTANLMMSLPVPFVLKRIVQTGRIAEKLGVKILGLGAFTKVVGDAGVTVSKSLNIPVTTGNSYTVATAVEATKKASQIMGHDLKKVSVVILGATGSIGRVCSLLMAREVRNMTLVARDERRLEDLAGKILYDTGLAVKTTSDTRKALGNGDIVITVTSAVDTVIEPEDLKTGAVVCDVARPRDVSKRVAEVRDDVLVIEGGVVEVPGKVNFNFNFGFPKGTAYACMAETMVLALEKRYESYTLGRELTIKQVEEIESLAKKHGFKIGGFRSFGKALSLQDIDRIKAKVKSRQFIPAAAK